MNRFIVIDLEKLEIINTNEVEYSNNEDIVRFSGSVSCIDKQDLIKELKEMIKEMESKQ